MAQPPQLTPEQRTAALEKAAEARRARAELKELLRTGSVDVHELFRRSDEDDVIAGMKVSAALAAMPGLGKVKANRLMEELGIADNRRLRGLGVRQREALLERLS
jgi:DnaJ-class molecular chaperone